MDALNAADQRRWGGREISRGWTRIHTDSGFGVALKSCLNSGIQRFCRSLASEPDHPWLIVFRGFP